MSDVSVRDEHESVAPKVRFRVHRLPDCVIGDEVHAAVNAWCAANSIPASDTPKTARFVIFPGTGITPPRVQIEQFESRGLPGAERPVRLVNMLRTAYVKTERIFDMPVPPGFEPVVELVEV